MYYIEVLRTSRAFWRYLIVLAGLYLLAAVLYAISHHAGSGVEGKTYSAGGHAVIVAFVCFLFASVLGTSLSRHLDHLDFALTKPRGRTAFAGTVFGIDVLALSAFFVTTTLALIIFHIVLGATHGVVFDGSSWYGIVLAFGSVLAWYSLVQAVSCGRDVAGWALAGVWAAALGLQILSLLKLGPGLDGLIVALNFFNPIAYLNTVPFEATSGAASLSLATHAVAIYGVAGLAALVAVFRWQRVEA